MKRLFNNVVPAEQAQAVELLKPAQLFAARLQARALGRSRWLAHCPAHDDRSPSLSIAAGRDGRVLLYCFAGCSFTAVVEALGLKVADLFAEDALSLPQLRQAMQERSRREAEYKATRTEYRKLADKYRGVWRVNDEVIAELAGAPDARGADVLARIFHTTTEELRDLETQLAETEAQLVEMGR